MHLKHLVVQSHFESKCSNNHTNPHLSFIFYLLTFKIVFDKY